MLFSHSTSESMVQNGFLDTSLQLAVLYRTKCRFKMLFGSDITTNSARALCLCQILHGRMCYLNHLTAMNRLSVILSHSHNDLRMCSRTQNRQYHLQQLKIKPLLLILVLLQQRPRLHLEKCRLQRSKRQ